MGKARRAAPLPYAKQLAEHRARLSRLAERRGVRQLKALYDGAGARLGARVKRLVGPAKATYTAHVNRLVLGQLRQGQAVLAQRLAGELGDISRETQIESLHGLIDDLKTLESEFTGVEVVVPVEEAARFWGVIDRRRTSLLQMHATSMARYGARVVGAFEEELGLVLATGGTTGQAIDKVLEVQDMEWWQAERIARCLPGETRVSGAVIRAVTRRWYVGDMVCLITEGGHEFSATPNHPMLTRRGWVAQGEIVPCDDLVRYDGQQGARAAHDVDVQGTPSTLAQIFDAVAAVGVVERRSGADPDFHGDGHEGEVEIARPERHLVYGVFAPLTQPSAEQVFAPTDGRRQRFCSRCHHLLPYEAACFGARAYRDTGRFQSRVDQRAIHIQTCCDLGSAFARYVTAAYFLVRQGTPRLKASARGSKPLRFRLVPSDARALHVPIDACRGDLHVDGNLSAAEPTTIHLDRVRHVFRRKFAGHVYNVTTPFGYYAIDGAYTGNTEIAWAYNSTHADAIETAAEALPDLAMRWSEHVDDATGEPLDDRVGVDSLAMHGQVAAAGGAFTMPATSPRGDAISPSLVGRSWPFPPNRPNDRAVLAPWRRHWGVPGWMWRDGRRVALTGAGAGGSV